MSNSSTSVYNCSKLEICQMCFSCLTEKQALVSLCHVRIIHSQREWTVDRHNLDASPRHMWRKCISRYHLLSCSFFGISVSLRDSIRGCQWLKGKRPTTWWWVYELKHDWEWNHCVQSQLHCMFIWKIKVFKGETKEEDRNVAKAISNVCNLW